MKTFEKKQKKICDDDDIIEMTVHNSFSGSEQNRRRKEENKQKQDSKYYKENFARISRRRVLLAIVRGRCATEKTLNSEKYKWNESEKKRIQECIQKRRESYLEHPIGEIQDKRYFMKGNQASRAKQKVNKPAAGSKKDGAGKARAEEEDGEAEVDPAEEEDGEAGENVPASTEIHRRHRTHRIKFNEANNTWVRPLGDGVHAENIPSQLLIDLTNSLYNKNCSRHNVDESRNDMQRTINKRLIKNAYMYMQVDDALDVFRYPDRCIKIIDFNIDAYSMDMIHYIKVFTDILTHSNKGEYNDYIEEKKKENGFEWMAELQNEKSQGINRIPIWFTKSFKDTKHYDGARKLLDELSKKKKIAQNKTKNQLKVRPYFNWQHLCNVIHLIDAKDESRKSLMRRLLIQLYTREIVARDDFGSVRMYLVEKEDVLKKIGNNEFIVYNGKNVILRVRRKLLENAKIKFIDDIDYFKDATAGNPIRKLDLTSPKLEFKSKHDDEYAYVLFIVQFKTYRGFPAEPFLLKTTTCEYISDYLSNDNVLKKIPVLPSPDTYTPENDIFLFSNSINHRKPYDNSKGGKMGSILRAMFNDLTHESISINDIRHSYASYFLIKYDTNGESVNTIIAASHRMFHTHETHINSYTHTSKLIYKFTDEIHKKLRYKDETYVEELIQLEPNSNPESRDKDHNARNDAKIKERKQNQNAVKVLYHIGIQDDMVSSITTNVTGSVEWDERDANLIYEKDYEETDSEETNYEETYVDMGVVSSGGAAIRTKKKLIQKSNKPNPIFDLKKPYFILRQSVRNKIATPVDLTKIITMAKDAFYNEQETSFVKQMNSSELPQNSDFRVKIKISDPANKLLSIQTNASNPFVIWKENPYPLYYKYMIDLINRKYPIQFPNYVSGKIKNPTDEHFYKWHTVFEIEARRIKHFNELLTDKQREKYNLLEDYCPDELGSVTIMFNTDITQVYNSVSKIEYPFVLVPTTSMPFFNKNNNNKNNNKKRSVHVIYRYLSINELETVLFLKTKG